VRRSLEQLVAAALIVYPRYRDPRTGAVCTPEAALEILIQARRQRAQSSRAVLADAVRLRLGRVFKAFARSMKAKA
jgi:capsular polysaccharide export protein